MQIRCQHCQRPFAFAKEAVVAALEELKQHKRHHYNAVCPHCGRTNRVSQTELKRAAPQWRAATSIETRTDKVDEKAS